MDTLEQQPLSKAWPNAPTLHSLTSGQGVWSVYLPSNVTTLHRDEDGLVDTAEGLLQVATDEEQHKCEHEGGQRAEAS